MDKRDLKKTLKQPAINTGRPMKLPFNANYYSACRGKSKADFINKLKMVEEELDATMFFYEMWAENNEQFKTELAEFHKEAIELLPVIVASINTANNNLLKENTLKSKIRNSKSKLENG